MAFFIPLLIAGASAASAGFSIISDLEERKKIEAVQRLQDKIDAERRKELIEQATETASRKTKQKAKILARQRARNASLGITELGTSLTNMVDIAEQLDLEIVDSLEPFDTARRDLDISSTNRRNESQAKAKALKRRAVSTGVSFLGDTRTGLSGRTSSAKSTTKKRKRTGKKITTSKSRRNLINRTV